MTSENPKPVKRSWGRSPALAAGIGILAVLAWWVLAGMANAWLTTDFGRSRSYYERGLKAFRWELAVRAATVRRFAQRTGHLPDSLSQCENDFIHAEDAFLERFRFAFENPRNPYVPNLAVWQDFLGLPILYTQGQQSAEEWRFLSSDPLPSELESYLKEHGGVPAASPEPFAVSSLFMRDVLRKLNHQEMMTMIWLIGFLGGTAIIIGGCIFLGMKWRRFGPSTMGTATLGISLFSACLGLLSPSLTTCYIPAIFIPRAVTLEKRLQILDDAVKRGEVSEDVAKAARLHIKKMFGYIDE